jgi:Electron transfer DM13
MDRSQLLRWRERDDGLVRYSTESNRRGMMGFIKKYAWAIGGVLLVIVVVGFLAFRPDKLIVDDAVDESLGDAFAATTATTITDTPEPTTTEASTTTTGPAPSDSTTTAPSGPVARASGDFIGIDHSATGSATVYEQDGIFVLRFEDDTDIQNGPDLYVWLLAADAYEGGDPGEYVDLGKIKGNVGGQNYELPPDYDPEVHRVVLVWCKRFSVPFAAAPLA